ncbi:TetR/AcrR family transcriptional regulator C-terminal domain-containing protein [Amycolatopsis sp. NPDC059021]|uniref:TetR/AcrR family transcriptional regulator C-terminal domain-containing protein n=1 Tax=Amycolatopsis sp. NPDC059021 TaxID=3346704 RepID=UPI00366D252C
MRLSRETVVSGALDLLDEAGLDKLTMRRLADALGVQNGATYWHFRTKRMLLEAMAESLLGAVVRDFDVEGEWCERLAELMRRLRAVLLSRRDGARLFSGLLFAAPNALAFGELMVTLLRRGGLSARDAVWSGDTLVYFVVGHTVEEQAARELPADGAKTRELESAVDPALHPNTAEAIADIPAPHHDDHFEYGLAVILRGLTPS